METKELPIGYNHIQPASVTGASYKAAVYECKLCGAHISDTYLHNNWHNRLAVV